MNLAITDIQLFQFLKEKVGEKEAEALVSFVDAKVKESNDQNLKIIATKEELKDQRLDFREDIANLRAELKQDIANLRAEVKTDIANSKAEIIKWMFIFWMGQLASFIAIAKFFFHQ